MLQTQMQTQPNPSLRKQPTQRDSETETATTQGDRASDKARDQGPWEPRGGLLKQGRGGGVPWASWGKYTHKAIWMRKRNQGVGGGRGAGQRVFRRRDSVCRHLAEKVLPPENRGACQRCRVRGEAEKSSEARSLTPG